MAFTAKPSSEGHKTWPQRLHEWSCDRNATSLRHGYVRLSDIWCHEYGAPLSAAFAGKRVEQRTNVKMSRDAASSGFPEDSDDQVGDKALKGSTSDMIRGGR
jgi:hypothetical protein